MSKNLVGQVLIQGISKEKLLHLFLPKSGGWGGVGGGAVSTPSDSDGPVFAIDMVQNCTPALMKASDFSFV